MAYLMGIDIGTSGVKTALFDERGRELASETQSYGMIQPRNGWAEQNPEDWWRATVITVRGVLTVSGVSEENIAAIGLSGQMHGLVMLDGGGNVIRPSIIWCDQRTGEQCAGIERIMGRERLVEITANPALTGFTLGKLLWVRENEPENYAQCRHILLPKDYIRYKLCGVFATEVSDASGMQMLDVPNRKWSDELLEKLHIDKSLLPDVFESVVISGQVAQTAANETGLKAGTKVAGGAGDNAAAAVGTGVVSDGKAFTTIGTSGVVYAHTSLPKIDPLGRAHTFCCAVPGCWHLMGVTQAAGLSLGWLRDRLFKGMSYTDIEAEAMRSPIGANALLYLPYLMGERTPHLDADARGAFVGLSGMHTNSDLVRAVYEGVAYSLRDCVEVLRGIGVSLSASVMCGGGAKSALWRQMLADIYGCDIITGAGEAGPALGVALIAGVGAGVYSSVEEACEQAIEYSGAVHGDTARGAEYEKYYSVYKGLYPALRPAFTELAEIQL